MFTRRKDPGPVRLAELETEIKQLKREIETLRREKAELREENDKLKQSLAVSRGHQTLSLERPQQLRTVELIANCGDNLMILMNS